MITARLKYRLRLAGAIVVATTTTVGAVAVAVALSFPTGAFARYLPFAAVSEARAVTEIEASSPDLGLVEAETRRTLESRPGDAAAWSRLAWIAAQDGRTADMQDALDRSYAVAPFGPDVTAWRLRFAYGRWAELTPELRRQANAELVVAARDRPRLVNAAEREIVDPAGRLAFVLTRQSASDRPRT